MKPQAKKRAKEKFSPKQWAKGNQMKAPKMKWAKFKKWTQIEDIAEHERQPKRFSMKCNP